MAGKYDSRWIEAPQPVGVLLKIQEESEVAGGGGLGGGREGGGGGYRGRRRSPFLRGHTMFGPLSLNPGRLSWLIMVDKPLYRTRSCHRH